MLNFLGLLPAVQAQLRILRNGKMSKVVLQLKGPHRLIPSHLKCAHLHDSILNTPCRVLMRRSQLPSHVVLLSIYVGVNPYSI